MKSKKTLPLLLITTLMTVACGSSGFNMPNVSGHYTYLSYIETNPKTWNTHNWESSDESYITSFTEMGLYDVILNEEKNGYQIVCEMAAEMPVDVSKSIENVEEVVEKYNYQGNISEGCIWDIALNQDACWEDGTPIDSETYVESLKRQLDPKMVNFRADSFYSSSLVVANAERYYKSGRATIEPLYSHINKETGAIDFNDTGIYYINMAAYSPYGASVFAGDTSDTSFYTVLNNRGTDGTDACELAAERMTDAIRYYCWKYTDHAGDYKSDWEEIDSKTNEGFSKLSSIKEEMMDVDIDIREFSKKTVRVRTKLHNSGNENEGTEIYSEELFKKDLQTFVGEISSLSNKSFAWMLPLSGKIMNATFDDFDAVGIEALDDYTIRLYLTKPISALDLKFSLSSNWIVNVELYDSLTKTISSTKKATTYATPSTGVKGYMSYGPYKLTKYESGKSFTIDKNEKWYGYTDGKHEGQFQMDTVYTRIMTDHNTIVQEFLNGRLDDLSLNRSDMKKYGNSNRLTSTYESYTQKISFNSDRSKLAARQTEAGTNKTILANYNFRKGLSLAMDRNSFASNTTAGSKGFTGLLNDLYLTDVEAGEMYRSTDIGKSVYNSVYGELGGNPYSQDYTTSSLSEDSCGYNIDQATYYVAQGIKEELSDSKDGHLKEGDTITIEFRVYDNTAETTVNMVNFINESFKKVVEFANAKLIEEGTIKSGGEIKITVDSEKDEDYYNTAKSGGYDMIFSTWGGAAINPIGLMQVYCDATFESCCEYGFKGKQDKTNLWIDLDKDGEVDAGENKTFHSWWTEASNITENDEYHSEKWYETHNKLVTILAGLEVGILNRYEAIPLVARATASLNSFKIENGSTNYINLVGYGGIRHMTFNYDDAEWNAFVKQNKSRLSELYAQ